MRKCYSKVFVLCLTNVVLLSADASIAATVDFNSPGQLESEFNLGTEDNRPTQYATGGVLNSGTVSKSIAQLSGPSFATYKKDAYDFSKPDSSVNVSAMMRFDKLFTSGKAASLSLGFGNENYCSVSGDGVYADAVGMATTIRISSDLGIPNAVDFYSTLSYGAVGSGGQIFGQPPLSVIPNNWYRISATFSHTMNSMEVSVSLDDYGAGGTTLVAHIFDAIFPSWVPRSKTQVDAFNTLSRDDQAWAGFVLLGDWDQAYVDNFSAAPIPGALWLLGSGLVGLAGLRARKKINNRQFSGKQAGSAAALPFFMTMYRSITCG